VHPALRAVAHTLAARQRQIRNTLGTHEEHTVHPALRASTARHCCRRLAQP